MKNLLALVGLSSANRMAEKIMNGFQCGSFNVTLTLNKRQVYKSSSVAKQDHFYVGVGQNCDHDRDGNKFQFQDAYMMDNGREWLDHNIDMDTDCEPNADGTKKDGSTRNCWTEKVSMVNLNWLTENNYEECGSILTQDEYGIVYEVMVQGVRSKVRVLEFS